QRDISGRTPLHYAATLKDESHTYHTLLNAGADHQIKDKSGYTPDDYYRNPHLLNEDDTEGAGSPGGTPGDSRGRPNTKGSEDGDSEGSEDEYPMQKRHEPKQQKPSMGLKETLRASKNSNNSNFPGMWTDDGQY
ncbi:hypothetical protein OTU49_011586, partial [Cherax quadricarinatus]